MRISPQETRAGPRLARLRQLHAGDAARAPCDAASADNGIEERKAVFRHGGAILTAAGLASPPGVSKCSPPRPRARPPPPATSATPLCPADSAFAVALPFSLTAP